MEFHDTKDAHLFPFIPDEFQKGLKGLCAGELCCRLNLVHFLMRTTIVLLRKLKHPDPDRNLEQAEIKVKAGLYVHITNFVTSYQLLTVKCFYMD